jgi:hypothetical protein
LSKWANDRMWFSKQSKRRLNIPITESWQYDVIVRYDDIIMPLNNVHTPGTRWTAKSVLA